MARKRKTEVQGPAPDEGDAEAPPSRRPSSAPEREASTLPDRTDDLPPRDEGMPRRRWWLAALVVPLVVFVLGFVIDRPAGQVMRSVFVGSTAVGRLDRADALGRIAALEAALRERTLKVEVAGSTFELTPAQVDLRLAKEQLVDEALAAGFDGGIASRIGFWVDRLKGDPHHLDLAGTLDAEALGLLVDSWELEAVDDPPFEGAVVVAKGEVVAQPPQPGRRIDRAAAQRAILDAILAEKVGATVPLPLQTVATHRNRAAVDAAVAQARPWLTGPLTLVADLPPPLPDEDDEGKKTKKKRKRDEETSRAYIFTPDMVAGAIRSRLMPPDRVEVYLDAGALEPHLLKARGDLERPPVDARFEVSRKDEVEIVPSQPGREVSATSVAQALMRAATSPDRTAIFPIDRGDAPALSTEDARALNIKGLVSRFTTRHPCCRPRVKNIHRIADLIDGVVLKPGETFSINEFVGQRTRANGFYPAPTIVHGEMKDTVGGGISQFATTFFNAAFHGGYEIIERQPHSYYFDRYPMGHEATLSFPKPDVIIKNDTEAGLLVKTIYSGKFIQVRFYGDNGGRKVERKVSRIYDIKDPPLEYIADDELDPEETKVKKRGQKGWKVDVSRVIEFPDGTTTRQSRRVTYNPRVRIIRVHSCNIPEGEDGYTGDPCPEPEEDEEEDGDGDGDRGQAAPEEAGVGDEGDD